jgi:hypothetical protein
MQGIRDIVKAKLSRRELLRMGLVSGSSDLLALYGLRHFKLYWGYAQLLANELELHSQPNTPFVDPLPNPISSAADNAFPCPDQKALRPFSRGVYGWVFALNPGS